jgi:hypothetical protein
MGRDIEAEMAVEIKRGRGGGGGGGGTERMHDRDGRLSDADAYR